MSTQTTAVTPTGIAIALAIIIALGFLFFGTSIFSFSLDGAMGESAETTNGTLMITDTQVGTGAEAVAGSLVTVNYVGMFENGEIFDASANHGGSYTFTLGAGGVIAGWDQGLVGMKVGGVRHLVVPPELGYGAADRGPIPGNSTLIFDVQLVDVQPAQ